MVNVWVIPLVEMVWLEYFPLTGSEIVTPIAEMVTSEEQLEEVAVDVDVITEPVPVVTLVVGPLVETDTSLEHEAARTPAANRERKNKKERKLAPIVFIFVHRCF